MKEADVKDSHGNIVISPGLKVKHKDSQFEYTVDSVTSDEEEGHVVVLRLPEEPRFEPTAPDDTLLSDLQSKEVIYEVDPSVLLYEPEAADDEIQPDRDFLAVPQKEFEKDYEVK